MSGYPVGTKCVITWTIPQALAKVGDVVVCGNLIMTWASGVPITVEGIGMCMRNGTPEINGMIVQETGRTLFEAIVHPIDWMRPIDEDIDESDLEVLLNIGTPVNVPVPEGNVQA